VLASRALRNRKGYAGYEGDSSLSAVWHVRHRVLESRLGRWLRRDPLGYVDGMSLSAYVGCLPVAVIDPTGGQGSNLTFERTVQHVPKPISGKLSKNVSSLWTRLQDPRGSLRGRDLEMFDELDIFDQASVIKAVAKAEACSVTELNFMRHCVLSCELTKLFGAEWAEEFMNSHEASFPDKSDNGAQDTLDDYKANYLGRDCGEGLDSLWDCCACCGATNAASVVYDAYVSVSCAWDSLWE
jgi:RHS repeat-associated protein